MRKWKRQVIVKISAARKGQLSQAAAASRAGISQPYWHEIESGKKEPSYDVLVAMCRAVGLKLQEPRIHE